MLARVFVLVEAAGVEPASEKETLNLSTCLVLFIFSYTTQIKQNHCATSLLNYNLTPQRLVKLLPTILLPN